MENRINSRLPESYVRPESERPRLSEVSDCENVPVIDLGCEDRPSLMRQIGDACEKYGFFQVTNHGVELEAVGRMMEVAVEFFEMPVEEKLKLYSDDPAKTTRLSTSFNVNKEKVHNWRDYLRLHCYPLEKYVPEPSTPPQFKFSAIASEMGLSALHAEMGLSAIDAEMGQLQNKIQELRRALNFRLRSVRTMDPARKEERIRATREGIVALEERQQALRAEQEALILWAVTKDVNLHCREIARTYCMEVRELGFRLQELMSENLGFEKDHIKNVLGEQGQHMAVNFYPPCPQPELTYGLPGHSDPNALTILLQDLQVSGLQVLKDNKWVAVKPHPNAFVINIGDQLQALSNGRYKSVWHRATVNAEKPRMSVASFLCPSDDAIISPPKSLTEDGTGAIYRDYTYPEYYKKFWSKN